jgi:hypothetical protein
MVAHAAVAGKRQDRMFYTGLAVMPPQSCSPASREPYWVSVICPKSGSDGACWAEKSSHLAPRPH